MSPPAATTAAARTFSLMVRSCCLPTTRIESQYFETLNSTENQSARVFMQKLIVPIIAFLLTNFTNAIGQIPLFETPKDCLDWFLISWDHFANKSACAGSAHVSGSSSEGFVVFEWFEVRLNDKLNNKNYCYIESKETYANGVHADLWEKSMNRGKEWRNRSGKCCTQRPRGVSGMYATPVQNRLRHPCR